MATIDTEAGNKLIAHFMGAVTSTNYTIFKEPPAPYARLVTAIKDIKYHTSFDWLMPVAKKVKEEIGHHQQINHITQSIFYAGCADAFMNMLRASQTFEIEPLYTATIDGIKILNSIKESEAK